MNSGSVVELLYSITQKHGGRIAIEWKDKQIPYIELDSRSNSLANHLISNGATQGSVIAVAIRDPIELIVTITGILKAGCAFALLDPLYPDKRLEMMVAEISPQWFILESKFLRRGLLDAAGSNLVLIDENRGSQDLGNPAMLSVPLKPDDMCYIYFTSGSTGRPKAVAGCHKGLAHFIRWEIKTFGVNEEFRTSQLTSPAFDPFLRDVLVPLCSGGTVCIPDKEEATFDAKKLINWIKDRQINLIHCVPTLFRAIVNECPPAECFKALKYVLIAGEQLFPAEVRKWIDAYGDQVQLVNLYGPTETTLAKFCYWISPSDASRRFIPVGKPIEGAQVILLDEEKRTCPPGVVGEIYIRTPFRTLGYYNQPEATRQVFIQNPFNDDPRDVIYKTGDMGRILEDGNLVVLGRKDHQVKVRGVRVELGEIETLLRSYELVKDAVVKDWEDSNHEKFLCAYIVSDGELATRQLAGFLQGYLPQSMIPSTFVRLEELPRNLNGKIDRKALPDPREISRKKTEYVAPRNETEKRIAQIWQRVLGIEPVGVNDNFFELGGHSLRATQVLSMIEKEFRVGLPLGTLLETPTVAGLALAIVQERAEHTDSEKLAQILAEIKRLSKHEVQAVLEAEKQLLVEGEMNV